MTLWRDVGMVLTALAVVLALAESLRAIRRRGVTGAVWLGLLFLASAVYAATTLAEFLVADPATKVLCSKLSYLGIATAPPLWLTFAATYSRRCPGLPRWLATFLWLEAVVTIALVAVNERHHLIWASWRLVTDDPHAQMVYYYGRYAWFHITVSYLTMAAGSVCLILSALSEPPIHRRQAVLMLVGALTPLLSNVAYVLKLGPLPGFDFTAVAFTVSALLVRLGVTRHGLLDIVPVALDAVFANLSDAVLVIDPGGRLIDLNPAATELLRVPPEAVGSHLSAALASLPEVVAAIEQGHAETALTRAGRRVWLEVMASEMPGRGGAPTGRIVVLHDATERHQLAAERLALEGRLHRARHDQSLAVLAAGIAHDFNNILLSVLGNAELAGMGLPEDAPQRPLLKEIESAAMRASALTRKMQAYAGTGREQGTLMPSEQLLYRLRSDAEVLRVARPITWQVEYPLPLVEVDEVQLGHAVMELLQNAIDAVGSAGDITVHAASRHLAAAEPSGLPSGSLLPAGDYLALDIVDTGHGMDPESLSRAFEPFYSTRFVGRGLGLPAAMGIARSHHGGLRLSSVPGQGTTASLLLPAVPDGAAGHGSSE